MRTDSGLNATFARTPALPGRLALVSQSGAICGAILDWAHGAGIGFTSVISLGGAVDVDFGEVLDFLAGDAATDAILLYVEGVRDARRFVSALRAAARVKPIIALKVGRYASGSRAAASHTGALVGSDAVFDAALRRAGTVRVRTYTQLFAAARVLSAERAPEGERLAILTNGGGPGVGGGQRGRERRAARRAFRRHACRARPYAAAAMVARESDRYHRRRAARALRRGRGGGARRPGCRCAACAVRAGRGYRAWRRGARARRRGAAEPQAGARGLARRHPAR